MIRGRWIFSWGAPELLFPRTTAGSKQCGWHRSWANRLCRGPHPFPVPFSQRIKLRINVRGFTGAIEKTSKAFENGRVERQIYTRFLHFGYVCIHAVGFLFIVFSEKNI